MASSPQAPYGKVASAASSDFSDTPLTGWVLDVKATTTKVFDFNVTFAKYLSVTCASDGSPLGPSGCGS